MFEEIKQCINACSVCSPNKVVLSNRQAYESLSDGLGRSASALVQTPLKKYQHGASTVTALATAIRAVPAAAIAPVSACAGAMHNALLGLRNRSVPLTLPFGSDSD
jgi:autophagy-related protein 2